MGICNCKERGKILNVKADFEVPFSDNLNSKEEETVTQRKAQVITSKQFLKLKTVKNSNNLSTERFFIKGKTIKGLARTKTIANNAVVTTKISSKNTNSTDKKVSGKRNDLLRKLSERKSFENVDQIDKQHQIDQIEDSDQLDKIEQDFNPKEYGLSYSVSNKDINSEEVSRLIDLLGSHYLFQSFSYDVLKFIVEELDGFQVEPGTCLYNEGEEGNCFFIIKKGKIEVLVKDEVRKVLCEGDSFGELALIQKCIRASTLRAQTEVECYVIEGDMYRSLNRNITQSLLDQIISHLDLVPWLRTLNESEKNKLAGLTVCHQYEAYQAVYLGDSGCDNYKYEKLCIIKQGSFSCRKGDVEVKKIYQKDYFCENWLFFDDHEQFAYDVFTLDYSEIFAIQKNSIEEALGMDYREVILKSIFKDLLSKSRFFNSFFTEVNYEQLIKIFKLTYYNKGEVVYNTRSEMNKKVVLILEGAIVESRKYELVASKGEIYGEEIINANMDLPHNLIAYPECIAFEGTWEGIKSQIKYISQSSSNDIFKRVNKIKEIPMFNHLSESRLLEICNQTTKEVYKEGDFIILERTLGEKFYILTKGKVRVLMKNKFVRELGEGNCFGELSLLNEEYRSASILAVTKVQCYSLTKEQFLDMIDDNMMEYLKRKICLENTQIKLSDLFYLSFLGKGKFGSVYLVHNGNYLYAIKSVPRKLAEKQKSLVKYLLAEKKIMLSLNHPFIVKMVRTLKTDNFLFFLMEFINGVNMEEYLTSRKVKKNVKETKFYGACMLVMIDYLHSKNISYRDLKPSNLIVDSSGYLKLIDFGTAKKITDFTHTVIGTPHFMAPEILTGKGYSFSCDFWSVGVTMFYIYYGLYPFGNTATDIMEIYKEILHKDLVFPDNASSFDVNIFLLILLNKRISQRMCNFEQLKSQLFYREFPWDDLLEFKVKPPYIPKDLREWSSNLKNMNTSFEHIIHSEKFDNTNYLQIPGEDTPVNFNKRWVDEF